MKKRAIKRSGHGGPGKSAGAPLEAGDVGHLDESLTRLAKRAGAGIRKRWKALVAAVAVIAFVVVAYQVQSRLRETRAEQISQRLYELTRPAPLGAETVPDVGGIRRLIADAEGTSAEKEVLKMTAGYLARQAESFAEKTRAEEELDDADAAAASEAAATASSLFDAAVEIVERGRDRFPGDTLDIGPWSESLLQRIRSQRDRSWLPAPRTFGLQPPPPPADDETSHPQKATVDDDDAAGTEESRGAGAVETGAAESDDDEPPAAGTQDASAPPGDGT